jgi:hypothetical protein
MANSYIISNLDRKLIEDGTIDIAYHSDYQLVHDLLNSHIRKTGRILSEDTFRKGDAILRKWLMTLHKKGAGQEKLTSYLRCGLAHLSFDFIDSSYESIPVDDLLSRALKSFKLRDFHNCFFKASESQIKSSKKKKPSSIKKNAKKSAVKKKTAKKPSAGKKPKPKIKAEKKSVKAKSGIKKSPKKQNAKAGNIKTIKKKKAPAKKTKKSILSRIFG